jgi:hypothetical protein
MVQIFLNFRLKIDIEKAHVHDHLLMHPHEADDQACMQDVVGICALWNWKYIKVV